MPRSKWYRRYVPSGTIYRRKRNGKPAGPFWYAYSLGGKRYHVSLGTTRKIDAGNAARDIYLTRSDGSGGDVDLDTDLLVDRFSLGDRGSTTAGHQRFRRSTLRRFFRWSGDTHETTTAAAVNQFLDHRLESRAPKTVKNERAVLVRFFGWLRSRGYIETNPAADSTIPAVPPPEIVYMDRAERDRALAKAEELGLWAVHVAAYTGLRRAEIMSLRWDAVDLDALTIRVTGKGGKTITLPMHEDLAEIFDGLPREHEPFVFPQHSGKWWDHYLDPLHETCPTLARRGQGWHTFRRTFGSLLIQAGVPVATVSRLMRHEQIETTMRHYAHLVPEHGRDELRHL